MLFLLSCTTRKPEKAILVKAQKLSVSESVEFGTDSDAFIYFL